LRIIHGLSFIEPALEAFHLDPFPQMTLIDALVLMNKHIPTFQPDVPVIVAQIYSQQIASDVKLIISNIYPDEHPIQLVHGAGTEHQIVEHLALFELDRSPHIGLLSALYIPPLEEGCSFEAFLEIVAHLRAADGCPWDREQTHQSLRQHLLEETYELLAALDENDSIKMQEELGDLLLQIYLHAQIAADSGEFQITDVLQGVYRKIINRHPHVFGDLDIKDSQSVLINWERIKADERIVNGKTDQSLFASVPLILPALSLADQLQRRAARVGFDWKDIQGVQDKLFEEIDELKKADTIDERESEIGDVLFSVVNLARWYEIDAESALRKANARFLNRFKQMEKIVKLRGRKLGELTLDELEEIWQMVKKSG
jgi:tetrapyrrole methylase family protein/MazG family protein